MAWGRALGLALVGWLAAAALIRASAAAGAPPPSPVKARLLADSTGLEPGRTLTVGVLLEVERGWHVYWKHPGDAGQATSVVLRLPPGLAAGPLRWPVPTRFTQPGDIAGFGYAGTVLLTARIEAPASAFRESAPAEVPIAADVTWLACKDICVPGGARLEMRLPVVRSAGPANERLFAEWEPRVPVDLGSPGCPATVEFRGGIPLGGDTGRIRLEVAWRALATDVDWFPAPPDWLVVGAVAIRTEGLKSEISFTARLLRGTRARPTVLDSVIAHADAQGRPRGIAVLAPLAGPPLKPEPQTRAPASAEGCGR